MSSWKSNAVDNGWSYSNGWSYNNDDDDNNKWHTSDDDHDSKWHTNKNDDDSEWHTYNNNEDSKWHINQNDDDSEWHTNNKNEDSKWHAKKNFDEGECYTNNKADDGIWHTNINAPNQRETNRTITNDLTTRNATDADKNDWGIQTKMVHECSSNLGETQSSTSFHIDDLNVSKHANGDYKAPGDNSCRKCGSEGHFARECPKAEDNGECYNCGQTGHRKADCPEPRKRTGECYNCGEFGHNKVDCTNRRVSRPFIGECNLCHTQGHRAADCPEKPPIQCKNCLRNGHFAFECTENRVFDKTNIADIDNDKAWKMIQMASDDYDMDDFKSAVVVYTKTNRNLTYLNLEKAFREANLNFYLIAQEKTVPNTMTIVDLQGQADRRYVVGYFRSPEPRTPKYSHIFPSSADENLERLKDAGDVMDSMIPVCRNCDERGHLSRACPKEKIERIYPKNYNRCINCLAVGHILRDCPEERVDRSIKCRDCDKPGRIAKDCPEPRSVAELECHRCKEVGHYAKDCPNNVEGGISGRTCRNCGEDGHIARECEKPKNPANLRCLNCDQMGHFSRDCPEPKDWSRVKCSYCQQLGHTVKRCPDFGNAALNTEQESGSHNSFNESFEPNKIIRSAWENTSINKTSNEWESYASSNNVVNYIAETINGTSLSAQDPSDAYGQQTIASKASECDMPMSKISCVVDISRQTAKSEIW